MKVQTNTFLVNMTKNPHISNFLITSTQLTFTCSKSTIKTLEKGLKYVQS